MGGYPHEYPPSKSHYKFSLTTYKGANHANILQLAKKILTTSKSSQNGKCQKIVQLDGPSEELFHLTNPVSNLTDAQHPATVTDSDAEEIYIEGETVTDSDTEEIYIEGEAFQMEEADQLWINQFWEDYKKAEENGSFLTLQEWLDDYNERNTS